MTPTQSMAILFADVSGSTKLYDTLGDTEARHLISKYIAILIQATEKAGGRLVKTIGDEVMCVYPNADAAATSALLMQDEVKVASATDAHPLMIRIGFHFGQVIEEDGDVYGDAVNVAARMAGQAKGGQIIMSGETRAVLSASHQEATRFLVRTTVKGKREPIEIHELTWGADDLLTVMATREEGLLEAVKQTVGARCGVNYGTQAFTVTQDNDVMTLGRGLQNTFVVPHTKASRVHAKIEWHQDGIVLVDQSTNGTYVRDANGEVKLVHRSQSRLEGAGVIGLGEPYAADAADAVRYDCGNDTNS